MADGESSVARSAESSGCNVIWNINGFWLASPDWKVATEKSREHKTLWTVNTNTVNREHETLPTVNTKHCQPWTENSANCFSDVAISNLKLSAEQDRLSGIGAGYTLVQPPSQKNKMETTNPNVHTLYWDGPAIIK